jgi:hypothetical protein
MRAPQRAAPLQTPDISDSSGCQRSAGHMKPRPQDLVITKSTDGNSSRARFLGKSRGPDALGMTSTTRNAEEDHMATPDLDGGDSWCMGGGKHPLP